MLLRIFSRWPGGASGLVRCQFDFELFLDCPSTRRRKMASKRPWEARTKSKRWSESFFLWYSPFWIAWTLLVVVPFELYERAGKAGYMMIGLGTALPCVILPMLVQGKADRDLPWKERHWVKVTVWIAIYSFVGNYFWTHYFYKVLKAEYTFPSWMLNDVPIPLYFMTHAYFCFYHTISNICLRVVKAKCMNWKSIWMKRLVFAITVLGLSYSVALTEALTIAHFPYYRYEDPYLFYSVGSLYYGIYFMVSFPVFFRMDESPREKWTLGRAAMDSLAAAMLVTILLDLWRLALGPVTGGSANGLPWMP